MTWKEGNVGGVPARVFRISFTGELSYEVNVQANYAMGVLEQIIEAGKKYNLTPYGTETMHVLRAEKLHHRGPGHRRFDEPGRPEHELVRWP